MNRWIPEPNVQDCDETAPEVMAGKMYSRRFTSDERIDGMWAVVTVQFYCDDQWQASGEDIKPEDTTVSKPVPADERYRIGQIIEFIRCTDPEQPGDTAEEPSAYSYKYSWFSWYEPIPDETIKELAENFDADHIYWDGLSDLADARALRYAAMPTGEADWDESSIATEAIEKIGYLNAVLRDELCGLCYLDIPDHYAVKDHNGVWTAECRQADSAYALKVARERIEPADTTEARNGSSAEDTRAEQFERAVYVLDEAGLLTYSVNTILMLREDVASVDPDAPLAAKERLNEMFDEIQKRIPKEA